MENQTISSGKQENLDEQCGRDLNPLFQRSSGLRACASNKEITGMHPYLGCDVSINIETKHVRKMSCTCFK